MKLRTIIIVAVAALALAFSGLGWAAETKDAAKPAEAKKAEAAKPAEAKKAQAAAPAEAKKAEAAKPAAPKPAVAKKAEAAKPEDKAIKVKKAAQKKVARPKVTTVVPPVVSLDRVEVQNYFGFWLGTKETPAEKGGAPLVLAFVFNVMNPNSLPVQLTELKFTFAFEDYNMATTSYTNPMWIPEAKTNQVRVVATLSSSVAAGNLGVTSGLKIKERGQNPADLLKKWWETIPDSAFPIMVTGGTASFGYEGGKTLAAFMGKFGK